MGIELGWNEEGRRLTLHLADGSRMRPPLERKIDVVRVPEKAMTPLIFKGILMDVRI